MNETNSEVARSTNEEPYVGMEFNCIDDAYTYYNCYALHRGFGVRKSTSSKSQKSGDIISKNFECDKSGFKPVVLQNDPEVKRQRDTRVGCKAKLVIRKNKDGQWVVTVFEKNHNHDLDTPRRVKKHRSHNIDHKQKMVKNLINDLYSSGMGPSRIAKTLNVTSGINSISAKNISNHLKDQRSSSVGIDGALLVSFLQKKKELDPDFYFTIQIDVNGILESIFWADRRSRDDYFMFGDVIVFDVTNKTNRFMMPFAPFTGVNHHRQSILFGCALLSNESEDSFIWLFKQFLECMLERVSGVIITDMDPAIYNAIKRVFPNTRHRFCSWHISKHLLEHVHMMRDNESDFKKDYYSWFNSKSVNSSVKNWHDLVTKYGIIENSWLGKMWEKRAHWVPAFLNDIFIAGMTSSSRSESINSFFDGFVNASTQLNEFVKQYDKALQSRRQSEELEDYFTLNSTAALFTSFSIEQKAAQLYTKSMFKLFQQEFKTCLECWNEVIMVCPTYTLYKVGLSIEDSSKWYIVHYDETEPINIKCECAMFECHGYLCKHILHIMVSIKHLSIIPDIYILKRWTIHARNISPCTSEEINSNAVTTMDLWRLKGVFKRVFDQASLSVPIYEDVYYTLNELLLKYKQQSMDHQEFDLEDAQASSNLQNSLIPEITIRDPQIVRTKGRPKIASRINSGIEVSQNKIKKRTCGSCGGKGHYSTTCTQRLEGQILGNDSSQMSTYQFAPTNAEFSPWVDDFDRV